MEPSLKQEAESLDLVGLWFILLGLLALSGGMLFGAIGGFQFLYPEFLTELPFFKTRPLHVSLTVAWIFLAAVGGIYYYLPHHCGLRLFSTKAAWVHFTLFLVTGLAILYCYMTGQFGGREYWEFPAILSVPIFATWILFGINYFRTVRQRSGPWPVYFWMWGTGIVFFFITFSEAYLWLIPYFRETTVREISVQWKAYGAMVGSWNMLVYGTAIFVAEKISGDRKVATSKLAFGLYFLGLTNLMFGWAHHIYLLPSAPWIRDWAYIISMTELFILGKIIWQWKGSLTSFQKHQYCYAYRFLFAADLWIFLNLILALAISVPALNIFTHGTHITVAHAMGSTIGINTMILLASVFYVVREEYTEELPNGCSTSVMAGFWLANGALLVFVIALILAGVGEGLHVETSFQEMMLNVRPYLLVFAISGVGLALGLWTVLLTGFRLIYAIIFGRRRSLPATVL
jgi:nitric oxide reductase subunit B